MGSFPHSLPLAPRLALSQRLRREAIDGSVMTSARREEIASEQAVAQATACPFTFPDLVKRFLYMAVVVKINGIPIWGIGEFTHFRTYFSGWIG